MAIYFKCPHCGNGSVDEIGETAIDYDNGLFKCTECGNLLSVEEDSISYEEYLKLWKQQESKNMTREEAIKIVKEFINGTCLHLVDQEALKTLIPELAENEDERVEKLITDSVFYQYGAGVEYKDVLDYLDRHNGKTHTELCGAKINGEPVPVENQSVPVENQSSQEWSDEDENYLQAVIAFVNDNALTMSGGARLVKWLKDKISVVRQQSKNDKEWTIEDAKNGDILANQNCVLIFDHLGEFEGKPVIESWFYADSIKFHGMGTSVPDKWCIDGFRPATPLEITYLMDKMKEAGYKWDDKLKVCYGVHC